MIVTMFLRPISTISRTVLGKHYLAGELVSSIKFNTNVAAIASAHYSSFRGEDSDDERPSPRDGRTKTDIEEFQRKHNITVSGSPPPPIMSFDEAGLPDYISDKLKKKGFIQPTAIQSQSWSLALSGHNLVGIAQTGINKTLSYILPAIVHINQKQMEGVSTFAINLTDPGVQLQPMLDYVSAPLTFDNDVRQLFVADPAGMYTLDQLYAIYTTHINRHPDIHPVQHFTDPLKKLFSGVTCKRIRVEELDAQVYVVFGVRPVDPSHEEYNSFKLRKALVMNPNIFVLGIL